MTAPTEPTAPPATPPAPPAAPPTAPPTAPAAPPAASENPWDDPAKAKAEIERLRAENGKTRTTAKETAAKEARDALLKQLGLNPDGTEEVDADKLAAQLASKDAQLLQLQRSTVASKSARTQGADVDALLDSVSFIKDLGDLDPAASDFEKKVDALVKTALEKNPKLKASQAAAASGISGPGGPGPAADIDAAIEAASKAGDHATAIRLKRQKAYAAKA